jgi:hypothetical protein
LLLVAILAITVYSQRDSTAQTGDTGEPEEVQILEGGLSHQLPIAITLVVPTDSGAQTVTVPLMLNLNLTVGPVDGLNLEVEADQPMQFISPLRIVEPLTATVAITDSETITDGEDVTDTLRPLPAPPLETGGETITDTETVTD